MRHALGVAALAVCCTACDLWSSNNNSSGQLLDAPPQWPDANRRPDAYVWPDAAPLPDAPRPPDAMPDATPAVCGDGVRAPGEVCFAPLVPIHPGSLVYSARLVDVNADGHRDLIYLTPTNVMIRLGDGAGGFAAPLTGPATTSWWLAAGDINNDGIVDLAAAGRYQATVWFGTGGGNFGAPQQVTLPDGAVGVSIAQVDGYPGDELVVASGETFGVWTWYAGALKQLASYNYSSAFQSYSVLSLTTADVNGDGRVDSLTPMSSGTLVIYVAGVDGVASTEYIGLESDFPGGVAVANVDSEPHVDLIATNPTALPPHLGISSDFATAFGDWPVTNGTPRLVDAAVLDGSTVASVVAGLPDTQRLQLFDHDGKPTTTLQLDEPMSSMHFDGDANGDGIADLVVTLNDEIVVVLSGAP